MNLRTERSWLFPRYSISSTTFGRSSSLGRSTLVARLRNTATRRSAQVQMSVSAGRLVGVARPVQRFLYAASTNCRGR